MTKTICVHNATFHADDALSVFFLLNTKEFEGSTIYRTRDPELIANADAVADVGSVYDHEKRRYDHHQSSFNEKFPGSDILCASCGIIYYHFGKEIITNLLQKNGRDPGQYVDTIYEAMYFRYVQEVDAKDNGIDQYGAEFEPAYIIRTDISTRISMLNPRFDDNDSVHMEDFMKAVHLIGQEFTQSLLHYFDFTIPAIEITKKAYADRFNYDKSGRIIVFETACKYSKTLKELEDQNSDLPQLLYALFPRIDSGWNIRALDTGRSFQTRKPLPCAGLRDDELSEKCGIPGGIFVHKAAFLGAFKTQEQALEFARYAMAQPTPEVERIKSTQEESKQTKE